MKNLITALIPLIIVFISACGTDKKDDPKLRLKYINRKYMFTLQFPEGWLSYADFEQNEIIDPDLIIPVIYFALPTRSREWQPVKTPSGYADLFCVRIFTREKWKIYQERYSGTEEFRLNDQVSGESKDFIYLIRYPESLPVDLYLFMKESYSVTSTFRILKIR